MTVTSVAAVPAPTLARILWPDTGLRDLQRGRRAVTLMLLGTVALWLSAKIQVPMLPVPMTMQTFVVLTLGIAYGWRLAGATTLLYLAQGAAGLPVFSGTWSEGGGIVHLYGPTAGYLAGFVVAATLVGWLAERGWDRNPLTAGAAMAIGNLVIYGLGLAWLSNQIGSASAIEFGLLPFLFGDAVKIALGAALLPMAWRWLGPRRA